MARNILLAFLGKPSARCYIDLASYNRLNSLCTKSVVKLNNTVHCAVVGNCNSRLSESQRLVSYCRDSRSSVKQAVFCMKMQMNKTAHNALLSCDLDFLAIRDKRLGKCRQLFESV